jgi:hypothetical protein
MAQNNTGGEKEKLLASASNRNEYQKHKNNVSEE